MQLLCNKEILFQFPLVFHNSLFQNKMSNGETSLKLNCEEVYIVKQVFTEMLLFQIPPL